MTEFTQMHFQRRGASPTQAQRWRIFLWRILLRPPKDAGLNLHSPSPSSFLLKTDPRQCDSLDCPLISRRQNVQLTPILNSGSIPSAYSTLKRGGGGGLVTKLCSTLCDPMNCSLPGSSVHRILQARILERIAILSSRTSSRPRNLHLMSPTLTSGLYSLPLGPPGVP